MALLFLDGLDKHLLQAGGFELLELGGNKQLETAEVGDHFLFGGTAREREKNIRNGVLI